MKAWWLITATPFLVFNLIVLTRIKEIKMSSRTQTNAQIFANVVGRRRDGETGVSELASVIDQLAETNLSEAELASIYTDIVASDTTSDSSN